MQDYKSKSGFWFFLKQRLGHPWPPFLIGHHLLELSGGPPFHWDPQFATGPMGLSVLQTHSASAPSPAWIHGHLVFAAPCCTWDAGFSLSGLEILLIFLMYIKDLSETHLALETLA